VVVIVTVDPDSLARGGDVGGGASVPAMSRR